MNTASTLSHVAATANPFAQCGPGAEQWVVNLVAKTRQAAFRRLLAELPGEQFQQFMEAMLQESMARIKTAN